MADRPRDAWEHDGQRWRRIESLCWRALGLPSPARERLLDQIADGDETLAREVEELLTHLEAEPDFLERPLVRIPEVRELEARDPGETRLGPYRLVRPLGRGGMGEVYLAMRETEDLELPVALKVLRRLENSGPWLLRFRQERRILANLRHPYIARLLDTGVSRDGRPYFVMEYVEGTTLLEYVDGKRLSLSERLRLFIRICSAVQHAHENLVVHRDLKPSNILITDEGEPKLLDFGIGKFLAGPVEGLPDPPATRPEERLLTPGYASPEQLLGNPVGTASDVHGLGILLYELLTGRNPFRCSARGDEDIERAVLTVDPPPPSRVVRDPLRVPGPGGAVDTVSARALAQRRGTDPRSLRRALKGDLDSVVLKALRKDSSKRYGSVASLQEDLRRHLEGLPVRARASTWAYRMNRFLKRHRWAAAFLMALLLGLTGVTLISQLRSHQMARERDRALEVRSFLLEMFGASGPDRGTDPVRARQLLDRQSDLVASGYPGRPELRAEMMHVLAEGYERLGLYEEAETLAREVLELRGATLDPRDPEIGVSLATLGWILRQRGSVEEARTILQEGVSILRKAGAAHHRQLSRALNDLGVVLDGLGEREGAERALAEALGLRTSLLGGQHRSVGVTANNLMALHYRMGDYERAIEIGRRALHALQGSLGADHQRTIIVQSNLAAVAVVMGDLVTAEREYRDLWTRQSRLQGAGHPVTLELARSLATVLEQTGKTSEAEALLQRTLTEGELRMGPDHPAVAATLQTLGFVAQRQGNLPVARDHLARALEMQRASLGDEHVEVGETLSLLADVDRAKGRWVAAERRYREAIAVYGKAVGDAHPETAMRSERLATLLFELGRYEEARSVFATVLDVARKRLPVGHRLRHLARIGLAESHLALGRPERADSIVSPLRPASGAGTLRRDEGERLDALLATLDEAVTRDP